MKPIQTQIRGVFVAAFLFNLTWPATEIYAQQPGDEILLAQRVRPVKRSEVPPVAEPAQPAPAESAQPQATPPFQVDLPQDILDFFISNTCGEESEFDCKAKIQSIDKKYSRSKLPEMRKAYLFTQIKNYTHAREMNVKGEIIFRDVALSGCPLGYELNGIVQHYSAKSKMAWLSGTSSSEYDNEAPGTVKDNSFWIMVETNKPLKAGQKYRFDSACYADTLSADANTNKPSKVFITISIPKKILEAKKVVQGFQKTRQKYTQLLDNANAEFAKITQ